MPRERLSMRKIQEVLRLRWEMGLSHRAIGVSCGIGCNTAREYLIRAQAAGLSWPLPEGLSESELERRLFPPSPPDPSARPEPDWPTLRRELQRKGVTLALLWQEYKARHPEGYQYSQFCHRYRAWAGTLDLPMRQAHKAGEKLFVDWAGHTMPVVNRTTGEVKETYLFVAAAGASHYTYAEATSTQSLPDWIGAHTRALQFMNGVFELVVPDNTRTAVVTPCRYEPVLNPTYLEWAAHNGCAIVPARVRHPRDKAVVEAAVLGVERQILAPLRDHTFFSLMELNRALAERLFTYNERPFQKLEGSRRSLFEAVEQPALKPLPQQPYEYAVWKKATVNIDYHIDVDGHYYSTPYQLVRQTVDVRITPTTVEVYHRGERVASHARVPHKGRHTTVKEHMPKAHREYLDWPPERLVRWANKTGPATAQVVEHILGARSHPELGYRACLGILRLAKPYTPERLEAACQRALAVQALTYKSIESILKHGLDRQPLPESTPPAPTVEHDNLRGPGYYQCPSPSQPQPKEEPSHAPAPHRSQTARPEAPRHAQGLPGTA